MLPKVLMSVRHPNRVKLPKTSTIGGMSRPGRRIVRRAGSITRAGDRVGPLKRIHRNVLGGVENIHGQANAIGNVIEIIVPDKPLDGGVESS